MKLLVCGSRTWKDYDAIYNYIRRHAPDLVIHGGAPGADSMAGRAADSLGIQKAIYPANWTFHGKRAGFLRNEAMLTLSEPDLVVAFWDGISRGTKHTTEVAYALGMNVEIITPADPLRPTNPQQLSPQNPPARPPRGNLPRQTRP